MRTLLVQSRPGAGTVGACLQERQHEVVRASGLSESKRHFEQGRFDLVALELDAGSAMEFCRWARQSHLRRADFLLVFAEAGAAFPQILGAGADDVRLASSDRQTTAAALAVVEHRIAEQQRFRHLEDTLRMRAQQQVAIAALSQSALAGNDLSAMAELVSSFIMQFLAVPFCCVLELTDEGEGLRVIAGFGWPAAALKQLWPSRAPESVLGYTLSSEEPVVFADLGADARFSGPDWLRDNQVVSGVSVAIKGAEAPFGVVGAFSSERRQFEEEDLRFVQGLANVLGAALQRQRADLEQQRLQGQIQHLQRLESVGQLAAGIAHDYNNVLTIIHGHVTLVLGEPDLPPRAAKSLKTALEAVERAAGLTRQLLAFSRKQSIELAPTDLNTVIGNVAKLLDRILGENVRLRFERGTDLPAIEADTGMIEQVVINLAVNARDAMPAGGRLVMSTSRVSLQAAEAARHPEARAGDFLCLKVTDTGCGMDEGTLRRIFEPFFTTKAPGKGTGLGLATVYGIVRQHRGWIEVQSQVGQGTSFLIFFPQLDEMPSTAAAAARAEPANLGRNETIFLVEDEPTLRDLARLLLEELGYQVVSAASGQEALQVWAKERDKIDLLLTDLVLPDGVTGFELAQKLQQERPALRVVLTSGYDSEKVSQELPESRAFGFIQKPYRAEALGRSIRQALERKPAG